ncbi:Pre-mRNA-splicing factor Sap61 [Malassezia pachydermatis]
MADTSVYESARMTHEEIEQYEDALVDTLNNPPKSSSHRLHMQWQLATSSLLDQIVSRYQSLSDMYQDVNGDRAHEWDVLARKDDTDPENGPFAEFYERLEHLQAYFRKYPERAISLETSATPSILGTYDASLFDMTSMERDFSGEEMGGRFLDLYVQYEMYINLKGVTRLSYLDYVGQLDNMVGEASNVPAATRRTETYRKYLASLCQYLSTFLHKTRPLEDMDIVESQVLEQFEVQWDQGAVPGWESKEAVLFGTTSDAAEGQGIWCDACQRFYAKQTVYDAHLTSNKHVKAADRMQKGETVAKPKPREQDTELEKTKRAMKAKLIARDEVLVQALAKELSSVRDDTRSNVERKAALTDREREEEAEALDAEMEEAMETGGLGYEEEGEDGAGGGGASEKIYNPLKLPMGWDGKPIPFWMYKLHGLRVEYKCEICSDHVYKGRKVFEKHFQESRHAFGMRALGLPNSIQFRGVTRIQDAFALAEKLKQQKRVETVDEDDTIEVEDEQGNAYTRKTYDLLKRQGLL